MNLKEKVSSIVSTIEENDNHDGFNYFEELMNNKYSNDPDFHIIKEKMDNLIVLLNKVNKEGEESFEKFQDLDFETEIWDMI